MSERSTSSRRDLASEIRTWLSVNGSGTPEVIARAVKARTGAVREVLQGPGFSARSLGRKGRYERLVYRIAPDAADGTGRRGRHLSQTAQLLSILSDGEGHERRELIGAGVKQPGKRTAQLRSNGHTIVCERKYVYRLVAA